MLKWAMLPDNNEHETSLPRECANFAFVLYRESDEGLIFTGFYDPDVPDEGYCDGIVAVPLRSSYVDTHLFNVGDTVYNAQSTSADKIFVKDGERREVNCWRDIWKEVITDQHGADNAKVRCYVSDDKDSPCNKTPIIGGHMLTTGSAEPGVGDTIYIIPICRSHNTHTNTKEMKITSQVYALEMKYKVDTVSPVDYPFVSVPDTNLLEDQNIVLNGIDVSVHNGCVDFQKVKSAGIDFIMIREGYGNDKAYKNQVDELFETNYIGAKNAGLNVGAYHYLYATTVEGARQEAEGFIANLKGKQFEMPIALDIEDKCQSNLPTSVISEMVKAFMDICEDAGYYCVLYSYESFLTTKIASEILNRYSVWCANISSLPHIQSYGMHQYSFTGRIAGVNTNVDLDHAYKDYPELIKSGHFNGF